MVNAYKAILSQIVTDDIRKLLIRGVESGLRLYQEIDSTNRSKLGDYASNLENRTLFSCLCFELERACNESACNTTAHSEKRTSSVFVEIDTENMLLHLRNVKTDLPQYTKDKLLAMNGTISPDKKNYIQLCYLAENGQLLTRVSIVLMDANFVLLSSCGEHSKCGRMKCSPVLSSVLESVPECCGRCSGF